ncbi:MAG: cytochrome C [Gammaproteobacteria bacterium]
MLKRKLATLLIVIGIAGVAGLVAWYTLLPRQRPALPVHVDLTQERIERGRYLVINVLQCVDCHSERDWSLYGGPPQQPIGAGRACLTRDTEVAGVNVGQEHFPGTLCIRNITPDDETGIGLWTDGEIIRAVREGVDRHGKGLFPIMPYFVYAKVADTDMEAVVAYLRTMKPVRSARRPAREVDFPLNLLIQLWPQPLPGPVLAPDPSDRIAYGRYLATIARCEFCHTPRPLNSKDGFPGREFAGGMPFHLTNERVMYSMNLTPDPSGLGTWTREQFIQRFRDRAVPYPVTLKENTLMNWSAFAGMTDEDLGALYDFFQTLPPVAYRQEPI